jgi:hypothetical protein
MKTWNPLAMFAVALAAGLLFLGCGDGDDCEPGQTRPCDCPGAGLLDGVQMCKSSGRWGECVCEDACEPQETRYCDCPGLAAGTQQCRSDATWSSCDCSTGSTACEPNETRLCDCPGGDLGSQSCTVDGQSWTACDCDATGGGSGGDGSGGRAGDFCETVFDCASPLTCERGLCSCCAFVDSTYTCSIDGSFAREHCE